MQKRSLFYLLLWFTSFAISILIVLKTDFLPEINNIIKNYSPRIIYLILFTFLIIFFSKKSYRRLKYYLVLGIFSFLITFETFYLNFGHNSYKESLVQKLGNDVYLLSTYDPGLIPICTQRYSIVKLQSIFKEQLYDIGCNSYEFLSIKQNNIVLVKKGASLISGEATINDTIDINIDR